MKLLISRPWRIFVLLVFTSGSIAFLSQSVRLKRELSSLRKSFDILGGLDEKEAQKRSARFSEDLQFFIRGDLSSSDPELRWRAVYERNLESPLLYARYLHQSKSLPGDYRETVGKLAPQNGWFDFWEIERTTEGAFVEQTHDDLETGEDWEDSLDEFKILDRGAMENAIALFHQAASKNSFTGYFTEMQDMLQAQLPLPETWLEELEYRIDILSIDPPLSVPISFTRFTMAALQFLTSENDREGFLKFERSARKLAPLLLADVEDAVGGLIYYGWLRNLSQQLVVGAQHFDLSEIEQKYRDLLEKIDLRDEQMALSKEGQSYQAKENLLKKHGAIFVSLATPFNFSANPVPITKEALKPSCRAENAVVSRIFTVAWYVLFICIAADLWIANLRILESKQSEVHQKLNRLGKAVRWKVFLFGVAVPLGLLLAIRNLTPLGQLDYSAYSSKLIHLALPLTASGIFLVATLITTIRILTRPGSRFSLRELIFPALPLAAIVTIGFYHHPAFKDEFVYLAILLMAASFVWLVILTFRQRSKKTTAQSVKKHLMAPACLIAAGLYGLATWGLAEEERYWIRQDEFGSPERHFITKHESKMVARFFDDLNGLLP